MPKRPVQHVLEDRSRAAFAAALPPEWILRHQTHDYGIDAEVEFVEEGVVTGRIFKVQLKATAKEGSAARLVRLPRDRREYFAGFGVPVLLVLYQATQDRLFVRWFESFDEEYDNLNSQSMVFRFRVADEWTAETSDRLSRDARIYQALSHLRHALPLPMAIASLADHTAGVSTNAIALALQGESRRLSAAVQWIDPDALDAFGRVVLDSDSVSVRLSDFRSGTTHYHASDWPEGAKIDAARIASDCLVNLAVLLSRADLVDVAAPLFSAYAPRSGIGLRMEMLLEMVGCFVRAHQVDRAIEVAEALDAAPSEDSFHGVLSLTWFVLRDTLEPAEHQRVVDFLKRRIALAESSGDQGESARRHYNLANWLGSIRRHREALAEYRLVVSLDPSYQDRAYYLADLAGTLFELGHFVLAAEAYGRAREMHSREDWLPLHADALMFAGRFAAADNHFSEWRLLGNYGDEWKLKLRALPLVRSFAGDQQERKPVAAWMRARDLGDAALNTEEARIAIECICLDGLCSPAWYVLGGLNADQGLFSRAVDCMLVSALVERSHLDAWAWVLVWTEIGIEVGDASPDLPELVVRCAARLNPGSFQRFMAEHVLPALEDSDFSRGIGRRIVRALSSLPSEERKLDISMIEHTDGATVHLELRR